MKLKKSQNQNTIRSLITSDVDELSAFQINKNRRYTQLQPGKLQGDYFEANLGNVQIFRESISAGALIESSPASAFIPFSAVTTNADNFNFCGKSREKHTLLQATGGHWDANFKNNLSFVVAAFNREFFNQCLIARTGEEIPKAWLVSKATLTSAKALSDFAIGLENILTLVKNNHPATMTVNTKRMITETVLQLALNALSPTTPHTDKQVNQSTRNTGVKNVVEFLHHYAAEVPTISELCKIAKLSERNLQYAFKEYLGITPVRYLRLVRLNGVKRDLLHTAPEETRVVDIAMNWGFVELGRFAKEYRQLFHELPSETLMKRA